jgi:preprotein translocase subunit SecB
MNEIQPGGLPEFRVTVENVYLVHARFLDTVGPDPAEASPLGETPFSLSFAFGRTRADRLTIAIGVTLQVERPYHVEVMYGADFVLNPDVPESEREATWRKAAATLAPVVLYPFIREMIHNLTSRSQAEELVLPVLWFGSVSPEEIELPPAPDSHEGQMELGGVSE